MEIFSLSTLENKEIDISSKYTKIKDMCVVRHSAVVFKQHMWIFGMNNSRGRSFL